MKKVYLMTLVMLVSFAYSFGQGKIVKGKVTDNTGSPIPGVSVLVLGTTIATATNEKGEFEITVPSVEAETGKKPQLVFSFIGSKTITVNYDADLGNIVLEDDTRALEEVVAIGYGTQEKEDVTGSISTIKAKDINLIPITSYDQALQGRAPGVEVSGASGQLGSEQRIKIRGISSLSASNQPLVVIDGIIVTTQDQTNFTDNTTGNPLSDINPNDIESVEVLKDAASAAIYGARASNGVLIVTTKKGLNGKTAFNANISVGISDPTHLKSFLNTDQYVQLFSEAAKNSGYTTDGAGLDAAYGDYYGTPYSGYGSFSELVGRGTNQNWQKAAYQTGVRKQYDFSARGGNEKTKFYASLSYLDQKGIVLTNNMERLTGRINFDHQVTKKIIFGLNNNFIYRSTNNVPENNSFSSPQQANALPPFINAVDGLGDYNDSTYYYANPLRAIYNQKSISTTLRNIANMYASWEIIKGLTFKSEFGSDIYSLSEYGWNGSKTPVSASLPNFGQYGTSKVINYMISNTLNYNRTFAEKHNVTALAGMSYQEHYAEYSVQQGQGLPTDAFRWLNSASQNLAFGSSATKYTFLSYFGRVNYKFNNRYLFGASVRVDGSSRFGANNLYGTFPAVSAGYIITEENFLKNTGITKVLDFFKLKASFGLTGNAEIGNYLSRGLYPTVNNGPNVGLIPGQLANPNLTWEKGQQFDIGIEYGLFQSRISGGLDLYWKQTNGMLLNLPIPITSGYSSTTRNIGEMKTNGIDFYINTKNLIGKFKWTTSFNISHYQNEVTNMSGTEILPSSRSLNAAIVGQPLGIFYGVEYAGVDPANGDALWKLADGTTTNNWSTANTRANYKVLGNPNPDFYGGITNTFEYKGIDLSVLIYGSYGNDITLSSGIYQSTGFARGYLDNQTIDQLNYWTPTNTNTNIPRPELDVNNGARMSSRYVSDGSYTRLKNVTLGYSLPKALISKIKFTSIRIYFSGQNLLTLTDYKGNDPETNYYTPGASNTNANLANGVDYYSAPQLRTYAFGLNLGF